MTYAIRHVEQRDVDAVHTMFLSEHVILGSMRLPVQSPDYTAGRLADKAGEYKMVAEAENTVVGFAELLTFPTLPRHAHAGEINMIVTHAEWQGKGVARALMQKMIDMGDKWLNLHRLELTAWATNERALKIYEDFGFVAEGRLRDYVFRDGVYVDAIVMGRLRPEG